MRFELRLVKHSDPIGNRPNMAVCEIVEVATGRILACLYPSNEGVRLISRHVVDASVMSILGVQAYEFPLVDRGPP